MKKVITQSTEHDDVITPLRREALRLGLALGPAPARAGPALRTVQWAFTSIITL